ncbi:MAG: flagellar filament capping protein FliD [Marmoricola sp.]
MSTTPTAQIGGLASGLDTTSIINQLIQLDGQTQAVLKTRVTTEQSSVSVLQILNSSMAALATKAQTLATAPGSITTTSPWNVVSTTSSLAGVTAAPHPTGTPSTGSVTFTVDRLASAYGVSFTGTAAPTATVTGATTKVQLTLGTAAPVLLDSGDGTMAGLVTALNASGTGVTAHVVTLDDGTQRLSVASSKTGAASTFTLTAEDGTALLGGSTVVSPAQDAQVTIGPDTLHSANNTFTGLLAGVDVTLGASTVLGSTATVTSSRDVSSISNSVKGLVDSLNAALNTIGQDTAYDADQKTSGPLSDEPSVRALRDALAGTLWPSDGSTMSSVGIQVDKDGTFTFDAAKFASAYASDPTGTMKMFTSDNNGFAARVQAVAKSASDPYQGTLTNAITSHNSAIKSLQDQISDWDTRLAMRKQTLTAQFTALETAMSRMQAQSSWLSSQIASLPSTSSKASS